MTSSSHRVSLNLCGSSSHSGVNLKQYAYMNSIADVYVDGFATLSCRFPRPHADRYLYNSRSVYQHGDTVIIEPHLFPHLPDVVRTDAVSSWDVFNRKLPPWNWMGNGRQETTSEDFSRFIEPDVVVSTRVMSRKTPRRRSQVPWKF